MDRRANGRAGTRLRFTASIPAVILATVGLAWPTSLAVSTTAQAKTPGKTYCFLGICHRVRTLEETRRAVGVKYVVHASHYDDPKKDRFNPSNLTSSGEWFRASFPDNAASPIWPNGTRMLVWNPSTKKAALLRVNNAGPYWRNRTLDVSRGAAEKLGFARQGVAALHTRIVAAPTPAEARYSRGRRYEPVPGFLGTFGSLELAFLDVSRSLTPMITPTGPVIADAGGPVPGSTLTGSPQTPVAETPVAETRGSASPVAAKSKTAPKAVAARAAATKVASVVPTALPAKTDKAEATPSPVLPVPVVSIPVPALDISGAVVAQAGAATPPAALTAGKLADTLAAATALTVAAKAVPGGPLVTGSIVEPEVRKSYAKVTAKKPALRVAAATPLPLRLAASKVRTAKTERFIVQADKPARPAKIRLARAHLSSQKPVAVRSTLPPRRQVVAARAVEYFDDDEDVAPQPRRTRQLAASPAQVRRPITSDAEDWGSDECQRGSRYCDAPSASRSPGVRIARVSGTRTSGKRQ